MSESIPATETAASEFAAFAAIDWADRNHHWIVVSEDGQFHQRGVLENTPHVIDAWARNWKVRFPARPIAVSLEQSRGPLVYQLMKYPHLVLFPVLPGTLANYRKAFSPANVKDDFADARLLLELVQQQRHHLRRYNPDTPQTRLLQSLVEQRRVVVDEKTRYSNRLTAGLKNYDPQVLDWIDDIDSPLGCDLLQRWPSLEALQSNHPGTLKRFFVEHNCRSQQRIQERIQAIREAQPAVTDTAVLEAGVFTTRIYVPLLQQLNASLKICDTKIAELVRSHPETPLFENLPGAGPALLPRLIVAFGTDRERYQSAIELAQYSGIAPVTRRSGKQETICYRRACPKFLRQTLQEFASHSIQKSQWARAFYDKQRAENKGHHAAVRALAFKWIRILFRCWKDRVPYDEATHMATLHRRQLSQTKELLGPTTKLGWKKVAGFHQLSAEKP